jgi:hypothetical protein
MLMSSVLIVSWLPSSTPFPLVKAISLQGGKQLLRVGEYAKSGVGIDTTHHEFSVNANFLLRGPVLHHNQSLFLIDL